MFSISCIAGASDAKCDQSLKNPSFFQVYLILFSVFSIFDTFLRSSSSSFNFWIYSLPIQIFIQAAIEKGVILN